MEIKTERMGSYCNKCGETNIVFSMTKKKPMCSKCYSVNIKIRFKKWVALNDMINKLKSIFHKSNGNQIDFIDYVDNLLTELENSTKKNEGE